MLDSWLRWLARAIDAQPRRIAIACLLVTLLAAIIVMRIPVTTDILDVMPDNTPSIVAFTDFLRDFGVLGGLVVVVEATDDAADTLVAVVQALGEQLSVSPYVESVDYNLLRSGFRLAAEHFPIYLDATGITGLAERLTSKGIRSQMRANRDILLSPLASPFDAEAVRRDPLNIRQFVRDGLGTASRPSPSTCPRDTTWTDLTRSPSSWYAPREARGTCPSFTACSAKCTGSPPVSWNRRGVPGI